ncbi:hypothetical protein [Paracoccus lutimaris]|uniref:Uncharacterized protein n=1 Tax=Paracoccus lutimaris TaxID=1490030 RepID=A0A368Z3M1_9RHOB|nr:hypothetical protein [Paracoccus lutimaris]RCW87045.1 hypothetical protein DFP89_10349 [Paracoccus lutimaris]
MIGAQATARGWTLAVTISLSVHAAAAGALIWRPTWSWATDEPVTPVAIQLTALTLPGNNAPAEILTPVTTPVPAPEIAAETGATKQETPVAGMSPILPNMALPMAGAETPTPAAPEIPPGPESAPESAAKTAAETDPRLIELFERIRTRLTAPCLLALPALTADGEIRLSLLASDDGQIPGLLRDLTQGLETEITGQAVLLDPRQCPGLTFARRDLRYPVFPLAVQLAAQDVPSGNTLRGTISGATGRHVSLILVDDNGATHDLRRFLVNSGGKISFEVPVARDGDARDTHQLLIAVATPTRPETVSRAAGELAETFFDQLAREVGPEALTGVASVYIR